MYTIRVRVSYVRIGKLGNTRQQYVHIYEVYDGSGIPGICLPLSVYVLLL